MFNGEIMKKDEFMEYVSEESDFVAIMLVNLISFLRREDDERQRKELIRRIEKELIEIDRLRASVGWPPFTYVNEIFTHKKTRIINSHPTPTDEIFSALVAA